MEGSPPQAVPQSISVQSQNGQVQVSNYAMSEGTGYATKKCESKFPTGAGTLFTSIVQEHLVFALITSTCLA